MKFLSRRRASRALCRRLEAARSGDRSDPSRFPPPPPEDPATAPGWAEGGMGLPGEEEAERRPTEPPRRGSHPGSLPSCPGIPQSRAAESGDAGLDLPS